MVRGERAGYTEQFSGIDINTVKVVIETHSIVFQDHLDIFFT